MHYRVHIEKTEQVRETVSEWKKVADSGNERDNGPQYDHVSSEVNGKKTTSVFDQTVDELDIIAVIRAVNGIKE